MIRRIQLTESDIRRMIFEAVNEITAEQERDRKIAELLKEYKTVPDMLNAWIDAVKDNEMDELYQNSGLAGENDAVNDDFDEYDDDEYDDDDNDDDDNGIEHAKQLRKDREQDYINGQYSKLQIPEYWALQALCNQLFYTNPLGFLSSQDVYRIIGQLGSDFNRMLTKNTITYEKMIDYLPTIVDEAFNSGKIVKFFAVISKSNDTKTRFNIFKTCIRQDAVHYLRLMSKDAFISNIDSTTDGNGNGDEDDNITYKVPIELQTNMDEIDGENQTIKFIKDTLKLFLNDDYMGDINQFTVSQNSMGVPDNRPGLKTAVKFILDNFDYIFTPRIMARFDELNYIYDKKQGVYKYNSVVQGKEFLKNVVAGAIINMFIQKTLSTPPIKAKDGYVCTSGNKELDKLCNGILKNHFTVNEINDEPVFDGNKKDCFKQMIKKIEPMWTSLGQGYLSNGEENKLGKGGEIIRRSKAYQRGELKPLSNPGITNESIRRIVSETIQRHFKFF